MFASPDKKILSVLGLCASLTLSSPAQTRAQSALPAEAVFPPRALSVPVVRQTNSISESVVGEKKSVATPHQSAPATIELKKFGIAIPSTLLALCGYALSLYRGTPVASRKSNLISRLCKKLDPNPPYFPNNQATWMASTLNSSSLFLLGAAQALKMNTPFVPALLSLSVVAVYALGAAVMWKNSVRYGNATRPKALDQLCLKGAVIGLGIFLAAGLSRLGYLPTITPPWGMSLEGIGIAIGLGVRVLALSPLAREFLNAGLKARSNNSESKPLPSLKAQLFWNGGILLNLFTLNSIFSMASIVPIGLALQNMTVLTIALWAYYQCGVKKKSNSI